MQKKAAGQTYNAGEQPLLNCAEWNAVNLISYWRWAVRANFASSRMLRMLRMLRDAIIQIFPQKHV